MELIFLIIIFFLCLFFFFKVLNNPSTAFSVILGLCIFFQDLQFTQRQIENKVILLAVVFALFLARKHRIRNEVSSSLGTNIYQEAFFLFFICFLVIQSLRGSFVYWRGITGFYWAIQFLLVGYVGSKIFAGKYIFPADNFRIFYRVRSVITYSLCAYTSGVLLMKLMPGSIFERINITNPSNTVLFFPVTLLLPIIILSIKDGGNFEKFCALSSWLFAFAGIVVSSSRGALIPFIAISLLGFLYVIRSKNVIKSLVTAMIIAMIGCAICSASYKTAFVQTCLQTLLDGVQSTEVFFKRDSEITRDLDRKLHLVATWDSINEDCVHLFFGYGYRVAGLILAPRLEYLYDIYLPHLDFVSELGNENDVATFGISSMTVDFGLIGVTGFVLLFSMVGGMIIKRTWGLWRIILLMDLVFVFMRLYGNNFLSYPLFYLALAPNGVFLYMIKYQIVVKGIRKHNYCTMQSDSLV